MKNENPVISQFLPIQTVSELNRREHWTASAKRHKNQQRTVKLLMPKSGYPNPCLVMLTRCGGRMLDDDNNIGSFKYCRDALSDIIVDSWDGPWKAPSLTAKRLKGRNDSDARIEWKYAQDTKGSKGIRIDIY